ncbi:PIR protein [Plasmodium ovale]|uniref:PIR protein n=2 Tax=Plasmodium ovale TaxID=36330 RepID=A0A1D3KWE0_PLAOA|nr:PIR protein [Plasmodium ovale]
MKIIKMYQTRKHNYLQGVLSSEDNNCVYYKYWFYNKLISNNSDQSKIQEFYTIWNVYKGQFFGIIGSPCKLHTKYMYDVKIIKLIYDFVLCRDIAKHNYNVIEDVEKCEFCNYIEESLKRHFKNGKYTCTTGSPYAFCMEHNGYLNKFFNLNRLSSLSCKYNANVPHNNQCPHISEQVTVGSIPMVSGEKDRKSDMLNEVQTKGENEETNG